jgi:hypothetical protein
MEQWYTTLKKLNTKENSDLNESEAKIIVVEEEDEYTSLSERSMASISTPRRKKLTKEKKTFTEIKHIDDVSLSSEEEEDKRIVDECNQ